MVESSMWRPFWRKISSLDCHRLPAELCKKYEGLLNIVNVLDPILLKILSDLVILMLVFNYSNGLKMVPRLEAANEND